MGFRPRDKAKLRTSFRQLDRCWRTKTIKQNAKTQAANRDSESAQETLEKPRGRGRPPKAAATSSPPTSPAIGSSGGRRRKARSPEPSSSEPEDEDEEEDDEDEEEEDDEDEEEEEEEESPPPSPTPPPVKKGRGRPKQYVFKCSRLLRGVTFKIRSLALGLPEILTIYLRPQLFSGFIRDCDPFAGKTVKRNPSQPEAVEDEAQQVVKARTRVKLNPLSTQLSPHANQHPVEQQRENLPQSRPRNPIRLELVCK